MKKNTGTNDCSYIINACSHSDSAIICEAVSEHDECGKKLTRNDFLKAHKKKIPLKGYFLQCALRLRR
ncbi:unnamed protein product [Onchocerca flexuosa]|uniref:DUF1540 domain-containing protein n=1 Tax=Onchocerca flexuosa TaxID=387005 RepID=A0A183HWQ5_9BILA|nr:unnamed protein product [Onchocerca flexuosa]